MKKLIIIALFLSPIYAFGQDVIRFGYDQDKKYENNELKDLRKSIGQTQKDISGTFRKNKNFIGFWRYDEMNDTLKSKIEKNIEKKIKSSGFLEFGELFWGKAGQLQNSTIQLQDLGLGGIYTEVVADIFGLTRASLAFSITNSKGDTLKSNEFKNYFNSGSGNAILKFQYPIFFGTVGDVGFEKRNYGLFFVPRIGFEIPKVGNSEKFKTNIDFGLEGQLFMQGIGNLISINNKIRLGYKFGELVGTQAVKEFAYGSYNCGLIIADKFSLNATIPINGLISSPIIKNSYNKSLSFGFTF